MEALVEFNYVAQEPDELTIRKGDIIKDVKVMSGGWWEGTLRDKRGMFPDNFVKVLETSASASAVKNEQVSVEIKKETVTLRNGSVVNNTMSSNSSCSSSSNSNNNNNSINHNHSNNNGSSNSMNSSTSKWCKVLFSYDPCNEDELTLIPNDMVEYLGQVEEGWWTGRLRGRVGVFPSNFVSPPATADDTKELCRVLFSYEAANEDELTLTEGEIVTLISRDAPDKGWWKGELRGKIGLFPDNFVQVLPAKDLPIHQDDTNKVRPLELNRGLKTTSTSSLKQWNTGKKGEKAYVRKSLDTRTANTEKKSVSPISPVLVGGGSSSSVSLASSDKNLPDKKVINSSSSPISSGIKRLIKCEDLTTGSSILPLDAADSSEGIDEELDGIEREEDTPLLHLTASRVKAPRRRLPSSYHYTRQENTVTNGTVDTVDQSRNDDNEYGAGKNRQPIAPWIEELKLNQMEKKKISSTDKVDVKKEKNSVNESPIHSISDSMDQLQDNQDLQRLKDKDNSSYQRTNSHLPCPVSPTTSGTPAYVPYRLYSQLLDRVATLEERQIVLHRMVIQLSEQVGPLLTNSPSVTGNKS
ncbi:CD2-associated protein-like isoform X2 [Microplitis mediator]|uniref:CD2-associated protein-like isoform X2 n=1 Tax=Microplitis mediator TaxID=375433 RepID=UPI002555BD45|nr:CD2-associated protein-like isoform X2 [Microplitis mediator]